jgi:hypothetical protein
MKTNTNNFIEKEDNIFPKILTSDDLTVNDINNKQEYKLKSELTSFPLSHSPENEYLTLLNFKTKTNDLNSIPDFFYKDIEKGPKNLLQIKTNNIKEEEKKYIVDNLIRRVKKIAFDSIMKFINNKIWEIYDHNIGDGVYIKKLFKNSHFPIKYTGVKFNINLLNKSIGDIFSEKLTNKYSNYPLDHNKQVITKLLSEEDEIKKEKFKKIFNMTFLQYKDHLTGQKKYEELEGAEKFYEKEMNELDEKNEYKEQLKNVFNNLETIFYKKKPRNKKNK